MWIEFCDDRDTCSIKFESGTYGDMKTIRKLYWLLKDERADNLGEKLEKMMEDKNENTNNQ